MTLTDSFSAEMKMWSLPASVGGLLDEFDDSDVRSVAGTRNDRNVNTAASGTISASDVSQAANKRSTSGDADVDDSLRAASAGDQKTAGDGFIVSSAQTGEYDLGEPTAGGSSDAVAA